MNKNIFRQNEGIEQKKYSEYKSVCGGNLEMDASGTDLVR